MAEALRDVAHSRAALQEVRRAAVTQRIACDADGDAGGLGVFRMTSSMSFPSR
jgi:hypothetical protein